VPWDALPGQMDELDNGEFRLRERRWRLAHSYVAGGQAFGLTATARVAAMTFA
jgi:hypothetical protein